MSNSSKAKWLDAWGLIYKKAVKLMWVKNNSLTNQCISHGLYMEL